MRKQNNEVSEWESVRRCLTREIVAEIDKFFGSEFARAIQIRVQLAEDAEDLRESDTPEPLDYLMWDSTTQTWILIENSWQK